MYRDDSAFLKRHPEVLDSFGHVCLSDEQEDVRPFTDVVYTGDGQHLLAAGGGAADLGVYVASTQRIDDVVGEPQPTARGCVGLHELQRLKRYGVRKLGVPKTPGAAAGAFLFSGTGDWDHAVRLGVLRHGLVDVTATYAGHRDTVTAIATPHSSSVAAHHESFATASDDGSVCVWRVDIHRTPQMRIQTAASPKVAYDAEGKVLAVTASSAQVDLYDLRLIGTEERPTPFASFSTGLPVSEPVESLSFAPLGAAKAKTTALLVAGTHTLSRIDTAPVDMAARMLLLEQPRTSSAHTEAATAGPAVYLPDGFLAARFTHTGALAAVNTGHGQRVRTWDPHRTGVGNAATAVAFNEQYWSMAYTSGCTWHCLCWAYNWFEGEADDGMEDAGAF